MEEFARIKKSMDGERYHYLGTAPSGLNTNQGSSSGSSASSGGFASNRQTQMRNAGVGDKVAAIDRNTGNSLPSGGGTMRGGAADPSQGNPDLNPPNNNGGGNPINNGNPDPNSNPNPNADPNQVNPNDPAGTGGGLFGGGGSGGGSGGGTDSGTPAAKTDYFTAKNIAIGLGALIVLYILLKKKENK